MSEEQQKVVSRVLKDLAEAFPGMSDKDIVEGPVAITVFGPLPSYSGREKYKCANVTSTTVGSFVICHAFDEDIGEEAVVLIERAKKGADQQTKFGIPGGYLNLDWTEASSFTEASEQGEQPKQAAVRELGEEVVNENGVGILDIAPDRLYHVHDGVGYRYVQQEGFPVVYIGHAVALSQEELGKVKAHVARLGLDPEYREKVRVASNNEVANVLVMPLAEAAALSFSDFEHTHELVALKILNEEPVRHNPTVTSSRLQDLHL
jgi:ADP-ribose pyrophosphatase YjhB (NUDIX family)